MRRLANSTVHGSRSMSGVISMIFDCSAEIDLWHSFKIVPVPLKSSEIKTS